MEDFIKLYQSMGMVANLIQIAIIRICSTILVP